jgi:hypothetical protein
MAHNEFELLQILVSCLDDSRNDLFVHIDRKVNALPSLHVTKAGLLMLEERVDVRWGDVSVVEAEYALFEAAVKKGPYQYYHLLSGADLPIKSQDDIHKFFDVHSGKEFIGYTLTTITPEVIRKVQRWHLFPKCFRSKSMVVRIPRALFLRIQEWLGIKRNLGIDFKKGTQWVSITDGLVRYVINHKEWAFKTFSHTFCSDEIFVHTLCWQSTFRENIFNTERDADGCMRAIKWNNGCLSDWQADDLNSLKLSSALFARKFNSTDMSFINSVLKLSDNAS